MRAKPKPARLTRKQLEWKLVEANAQQAHVYYFATKELEKASTDSLMASGVTLQLTALGGRKIIDAVLIRDGLSPATVAAIKADLKRSFDLATSYSFLGGKDGS